MKSITVFCLLFMMALGCVSAQGQEQVNAVVKREPFGQMVFRVPENSYSVKEFGGNMVAVSLNTPVYFIPRNLPATILSYTVKDSGNYLVIWKLKARDTTTFYPNSPDALAIDSAATAWLSINRNGTETPKELLIRQYKEAADSSNDKLSFFSIPVDCSEPAHLNKSDTLSLMVTLYGSLKLGTANMKALPVRLLTTFVIEHAEMILVKVNDKD